jgi:hypothetical protein
VLAQSLDPAGLVSPLHGCGSSMSSGRGCPTGSDSYSGALGGVERRPGSREPGWALAVGRTRLSTSAEPSWRARRSSGSTRSHPGKRRSLPGGQRGCQCSPLRCHAP